MLALCGLLVLASAGCAPGPAPGLFPPKPGETVKKAYVTRVAWHTGVAVRRADIPQDVWPQAQDMPASDYLEVGWGDADYYQADDPGSSTTLTAAFLPTKSVLQVMGVIGPIENEWSRSLVVEIDLSEAGLRSLCQYIAHSYAGDEPHPAAISQGHNGERSRFYRARGRFCLCKTCNVWTARALRAAGCPVRDAVTVEGLLKDVKKIGKVVRQESP